MKKILFLIFLLAFLVSPLLALGDDPYDPNLEIEYPWLDDAADETEQVGTYVAYLFDFGVMIVGLILFGALIYGGFVFMTSAGDPGRRSEAKRKIIAAFLGTILLLGFYVLINEINPDLLQVSLEEPEEIKYPPIPAGSYICSFDFPGISGILSNYESGDSETRNNAIKEYYDTLRSKEEENDDYYCTIINTPRNIQVQLAVGDNATYFIVPDEDGNYNYGMIFFDKEDGLRKARADGGEVKCHVSIGKESIVGEVEDIGFFTKSVAPISLESEGVATIRLYEGYTFNSDGDSRNNEKTEGYAFHEEVFSVGAGSTENIIGEAELSSFPSKETTVDIESGIYYGIRSLEIEESPVISIFKKEKDGYNYCNVIIEDRSNLASIVQSATVLFTRIFTISDFNGLPEVLRFNEIHLIKGQLMDSER